MCCTRCRSKSYCICSLQAMYKWCYIHLSRKCVALHTVLRAKLIVEAVVYVNLVESVAIGQRAASQIYRDLGALHVIVAAAKTTAIRIIHCLIDISREDYTMSCICYFTTYLTGKHFLIIILSRQTKLYSLYVYRYVKALSWGQIISAGVLSSRVIVFCLCCTATILG